VLSLAIDVETTAFARRREREVVARREVIWRSGRAELSSSCFAGVARRRLELGLTVRRSEGRRVTGVEEGGGGE
jgi:hypothetical protein